MMYGNGFGWGWMWFGGVMLLLILAALIILIIRAGTSGSSPRREQWTPSANTARQIAEERLRVARSPRTSSGRSHVRWMNGPDIARPIRLR